MLMKWMLALGLQGAALVTIAPVGLSVQPVRQLPAADLKQPPGQPEEVTSAKLSLLDSGFRSMYALDFSGAQQQFIEYQRENPGDPMGPAADAAELLFSEFNRLGVLQSQMFIKDPGFAASSTLAPDPAVVGRFNAAIERCQALAEERLSGNSNDRDALLAAAFAAGLQAEFLALVQNHNLAALRYARKATGYAQRLLTVCPDCYDAYVTTGVGKYLIGSRSVPVRWILRASGLTGNKSAGITDLWIAAQHGYYLAPFAEILLSIAYVRDKEPQQARVLLADLRAQFPENSLFGWELERLDEVVER